MKRPGNVLILTLMACALLALVLFAGVQVAGLRTATRQNQIADLQLEQLHRTALADALEALNASGESIAPGRVLLSDEPVSGQTRQLTVRSVEERLVTVESRSSLSDGSQRRHQVLLFALPLEARFAFAQPSRALYYDADRGVPDRWLENHAEEDLVIVCDRRPGDVYSIGSGGRSVALTGSLYVSHLENDDFSTTLRTSLSCDGNAVFAGDVHLLGDLSCQTAWIDGTLTIGESVSLRAETVYLAEDVSEETLAGINAATIYMPHPPEPDAADDESDADVSDTGRQILPLPDEPQPTPEKTAYLMLWQLE